jgi:hypothetical protein
MIAVIAWALFPTGGEVPRERGCADAPVCGGQS